MKNNYLQFIKSALLLTVAVFFLHAVIHAQTFEKYYQDGQLFVKFHDDFDPNIPVASDNSVNVDEATFFAGIFDRYEVLNMSRPLDAFNDIKLLRTFHITFADHMELERIIGELEDMPEIEYAEKVALHYIDVVPNDSLYNLVNGPMKWKWHLDVINAEQAWTITTGSPDIKIAVVDNAVWTSHPDLESEIVLSWDATNNTPNSSPPGSGNPGAWSHGTHCAGLASAATNNNVGIAAIGYNTSLIGVKATTNPDFVTHSLQGVNWAVNNGADVISMSFGGSSYNQTFQNVVNTGVSQGIIFLASAGNENNSIIRYPAGYNGVLAVASTNDDDVKSNFSSFGSYVDISAPGGFASPGPAGLLSSTYEQTSMGYYDTYFGTSMSCPVAAGLAGLLKSINPQLTTADAKIVLQSTCDDISAQNPNYIGMLGAGRINAYEAVKAVPFSPIAEFSTPVTTITPGTTINFSDHSRGIPTSWSWFFDGATPNSSNSQNPENIFYNWPGSYKVVLTVTNNYGNDALTIEEYIHVTATPAPYIQFEVSESHTCIYNPVVFEDLTLYEPNTWNWEFNPDTYEFINGTNASSQHPEVIFKSPGLYDVTLTTANINGVSIEAFEDYFLITGMDVPAVEDFESGTPGPFELTTTERSHLRINHRAANESDYGMHFTGGGIPAGWSGSIVGTTPEQAWNQNTLFHASANICMVDATEFAGIHLYFDLRQTYSMGVKTSWFRVLVNDSVQVADSEGNMNFNPVTNEDPFVRRHFDLSDFAGTTFSLTLQSCCRLHDGMGEEGDNAFVDNFEILGSLVGFDENLLIPVQRVFVYPNPVKERLHIDLKDRDSKHVDITLHSITGQKVLEERHFVNHGDYSTVLDVSGVTPGMYLLLLKDAGRVEARKVVIR